MVSTAEEIVIEVANSGTWVTPGTSVVHSTNIGLENLRQRLERYYPGAHEFMTEARDDWVVVKLRIGTKSEVRKANSEVPPSSIANGSNI